MVSLRSFVDYQISAVTGTRSATIGRLGGANQAMSFARGMDMEESRFTRDGVTTSQPVFDRIGRLSTPADLALANAAAQALGPTPALRDRVDPLIGERAPWLYRPGMHVRLARGLLHLMLGYNETIRIGDSLDPLAAPDVMDRLAELFALNVDVAGLERIPREGPAMITCNHPTGLADGVIIWSVLRKIRPDLFFFANRDAIRVMPQMSGMIAPVEWRPDKRSIGSNRETLTYCSNAFAAGRLAVLFPSGRLAKRRGLKLYERPWMPSAAMLARKYSLPVIPVHITARNSALFYLFDAIHPTLRDVTLFHEVINKADHSFRIRAGKPLDGGALPRDSEAATDVLFRATMRAVDDGDYSVLIPRARPTWAGRQIAALR